MSTNDIVSILPNSREAEMMVLGSMLNQARATRIALSQLEETDFYYIEHQTIFRTLKHLVHTGHATDLHVVAEELKRIDKLAAAGGIAGLAGLSQFVGSSAIVEEYIAIVREKAGLRNLLGVLNNIQRKAVKQDHFGDLLGFCHEQIKHLERKHAPTAAKYVQFLSERENNFLLSEPPKKPMLLEYASAEGQTRGFLPKGIVAMLVGAGGVGKTHLLAQLAVAVASGTPWLGTFAPTAYCGDDKKGHVFLGFGENQFDDIHRLLYKAARQLRRATGGQSESALFEASKRIAALSFSGQQASFIHDGKPTAYFRQLKNHLEDSAPTSGWSLIVLDPISRMLGADAESDNAAATQFIALLEELVIDLPGNPTVLFAHHMNKSAIKSAQENKTDQTAARGSSALTDGVRWQLNVMKTKEKLTLSMEKSNFTPFADKIDLLMDNDGTLRIEAEKKAIRI